MSIMDLMNINYKEIFNGIMSSKDAQSLMADFINHCILHCSETRECIIDAIAKDETFISLIEQKIEKVAKKNKMKSDYFNE